ncbi:hypothetical protein LJR230_001534 [Trinickia sp. LjRoot230]|uniref:hypothetical protein n=1 Tax=Trinickia sp. LjRoot230 TaxID=3342288 RepID=UPI003ECEF4C8
MHSLRRAASIAALAMAALALACANSAYAAKGHTAFAVVTSTMRSAADEAATQRLLQAIGAERLVAFTVYDGNIKGAAEPCADNLYAQRQQVLASSPIPLVFIAGEYDWADCGSAQGGRYDVAERLDFLRQTIYADNASLGQSPLAFKRESDVARFHSYRENVRWQAGDIVFAGLNVVGGNNHYLSAGGRNGEYDDRAIATAFWLEHTAEYARRRNAAALVVFLQADPEFERYERAERFAWLRLGSRGRRDGYQEFKRSLVKAAQTFRGPLIVVHQAAATLSRGFSIDQPLFDDKGQRLSNVTRITIGLRDRTTQWVRVDAEFDKQVPFQVSVRRIPAIPAAAASLPAPANQPMVPSPNTAPAIAPSASGLMPAPPALPRTWPAAPASEPPLLPEFGKPASSLDDGRASSAPQPEPAAPPVRQKEPVDRPQPGLMQGGS